MCDSDARVQLCCSAGRMLCAQLAPDSQMWRRRQLIAELSTPETHARSVCCAVACFRARLWCMFALRMRGCSFAAQRGACCVHSCHRIHKCVAAQAIDCRVEHNRGSRCYIDGWAAQETRRMRFRRRQGVWNARDATRQPSDDTDSSECCRAERESSAGAAAAGAELQHE